MNFYTVSDYLFLLQSIGERLRPLGKRALLYLAAAVSDFYLPEEALSDHKIQSDEGALILKLEPVPKVIKPLVVKWCPDAFIISFKLETRPEILLTKARQALEKYKHNVVIANVLTERKNRVILVRHGVQDHIIENNDPKKEIEQTIVQEILTLFVQHKEK